MKLKTPRCKRVPNEFGILLERTTVMVWLGN
jgi:phage FluMu protein Com